MTDANRDLGPIMQILLPVTDVDRAAAFYADVLGLPLLFRYPGNAFFDVPVTVPAPGEYVADGSPTAMYGTWRLQTIVRLVPKDERERSSDAIILFETIRICLFGRPAGASRYLPVFPE